MPLSGETLSDAPDIDSTELTDEDAKLRWTVSVSLEHDMNPVLTWKGEVTAGSPPTAAARAIRAARKAFPGKRARSWAIVQQQIA